MQGTPKVEIELSFPQPPILRWAGSKKRLLPSYKDSFPRVSIDMSTLSPAPHVFSFDAATKISNRGQQYRIDLVL